MESKGGVGLFFVESRHAAQREHVVAVPMVIQSWHQNSDDSEDAMLTTVQSRHDSYLTTEQW